MRKRRNKRWMVTDMENTTQGRQDAASFQRENRYWHWQRRSSQSVKAAE